MHRSRKFPNFLCPPFRTKHPQTQTPTTQLVKGSLGSCQLPLSLTYPCSPYPASSLPSPSRAIVLREKSVQMTCEALEATWYLSPVLS